MEKRLIYEKKNERLLYTREFYEVDEKYLRMLESRESKEQWFQDYLRAVLRFSKPESKILECGCGPGVTTSRIHERRPNVLGTDFSERFIKKAKEKGDYFKVMDATNLKFPDKSFDMVCFADLIEHVSDADKAFSEMDRVLKDAGMLVIQCPNLFCNLFSTNYKKTPESVARKIKHLFLELREDKIRKIPEYKVDVLIGDADAVTLMSPIWVKRMLKKRGYDLKYFTTYSLYFKPRFPAKQIFYVLSKAPLSKYLGGRMVIVAQKRPTRRNFE